MKDKKQFYSNEASYKIDAHEKDYLYIKESQIAGAGMGLFTAIPIFKEDIISLFKGELLSRLESEKRRKRNESSYFVVLPDHSILDSMKVKCFAKYANDANGANKSDFKNNAKISLDEVDNVCIVAIRNIAIGEEIFCNYGTTYWKSA